MYRRRRRAALLVLLALTVLVAMGQMMGKDEDRPSRKTAAPAASSLPDTATGVATTAASPASAAEMAPSLGLAAVGPAALGAAAVGSVLADQGRAAAQAPPDTAYAAPDIGFVFVGGYGPVLGTAGPVRGFKIAVQNGIGQGDGRAFADVVDRILGDPRSWIAARQFRLQRVAPSAAAEFTIYLASADTSERMCAQGGLKTDGFTSCRLPGRVIINLDRWLGAVPGYGAPLDRYRAYAINHEVGHQLGHGHEACPGRGRPAPVMMQQTYGLKGCVAYSWPYLDGSRYAGSPIG